jgi:serine/threonine protein kinase
VDRKRLSIDLVTVRTLFEAKQSPYRIEKALGQGVFTAAYLATHEFTGVRVVVRVLRPKFVDDHPVRIHFLEVGKRTFTYVHHSLVHTRDVQAFADARMYYTVRDYIEGVTLQDLLAQRKEFQPLQILEILRQALEALTPIHHHGASHGGIKPSNLFLCDAERVRVVLGDPCLPIPHFDMERLCYDYRYAAPEMFRSGGCPGPQSDFYSLGCVGFELLCGSPPFMSDNAFDLGAKHMNDPIPPLRPSGGRLGPAVDDFFNRLLAKLPSGRFRDLAEAFETLEALRDRLRAPSATGARPVTLLGRESLLQFDPLHSVLALTGSRGTEAPSEDDARLGNSALPGQAANARAPELADLPDYDVLRELGRGGMGVVYLAQNKIMGRMEVLKVVGGHLVNRSGVLDRFLREIRHVARLQHPNIVTAYSAFRLGENLVLAMEYVEGLDLSRVVKSRGPLPVPDACDYIRQAALGLQHAHEHGMVHRDMKPGNLMLTGHGNQALIKVLDFGLARIQSGGAADGTLTAQGQMLGTPDYIAPEQISNAQQADIRADIYSLGCSLYYLLTGVPPFQGNSLYEILQAHHDRDPKPVNSTRPDLPMNLAALVSKMMAKDPDQRFQTPAEVAHALEAFVTVDKKVSDDLEVVVGQPFAEELADRIPAVLKAAPATITSRKRRWWMWFSALFPGQ